MNAKNDMGINKERIHLGYFLAVGLLSTITMDLAALIMIISGMVRLGSYQIVPNLLGRWVAAIPTGTLVHSSILETPPFSHEKVVGLLCHYLIGVTLTSLFVYPHIRIWHRKIELRSAILYGIATCIFPYFIMFPAMGFGVMALKLKAAGTLMSVSFLNHVAFGLGIFAWSNLLYKPLGNREPSNERKEESLSC
jgi:hypothetical protein